MTMSKAQLSVWPHNQRPSARHVWKVKTITDRAGAIEVCQRCGATFIEKADTRGPVYCYATPDWRAAHPDDDGKEG